MGDGKDGALGRDNENDVGDNEHPSAVSVVAVGWTAAQVSAGLDHSCVMSLDGKGRCWGRNGLGQLGQDNINYIGNGAGTAMTGLTDIDFGSGIKISSIHAGNGASCVITTAGGLRCFGDNSDGEAGQGHTDNISDGSSRTIESEGDVNLGGASVAQVAIGGGGGPVNGSGTRCALSSSGQVKCWGHGASGFQGYGDSTAVGQSLTTNLPPGTTMSLAKRWYNFLGLAMTIPRTTAFSLNRLVSTAGAMAQMVVI